MAPMGRDILFCVADGKKREDQGRPEVTWIKVVTGYGETWRNITEPPK